MKNEDKADFGMRGISRIDSRSTHGWFVRAYRNGKTFSRLFSDRGYGNAELALEAASAYRDELYQKIKEIPRQPRKRRLVVRDARNKTGIIGVTRTARKMPNGTVSESYSVSWRPSPGVQKCTSYSIRKYGEKGAFLRAVEHRTKMLEESYGKEEAEKWARDINLEDKLQALSP